MSILATDMAIAAGVDPDIDERVDLIVSIVKMGGYTLPEYSTV